MGGVIYIVRHGATKMNNTEDMSEDRIRGWTDVPLAENGRKEAQAAGLKLKSKGIQAIVASTLSRAHETAEIIGKIVGVKPVASEGLRPWNLGELTGKSTKEALPKIADYARSKPDEAVPKGESFNQFKERAFAGLADAIEANQGKVLVIVTHHRNERLYEAWEKAGRPEDLSIDMGEFLQKGDPPGGIKTLAIGDVDKWQEPGSPKQSPQSKSTTRSSPDSKSLPAPSALATRGPIVQPQSSKSATPEPPSTARSAGPAHSNTDLPSPSPAGGPTAPSASPAGKNGPSMQNPSDEAPEAQKATKAEAHYGIAKAGSGDRCATCKSFRPPNDCVKVEGRVAPAGWCQLGHSKADGHAFYGEAEAEASPQMGMGRGTVRQELLDPSRRVVVTAQDDGHNSAPKPAMNAAALSHGRAIAGAKALHAVGHITAKERDRHIGASQKVISKRKAFGSWAP